MHLDVEEPAPGGALRYDQYFPTMLPFQRQHEEALLLGEQQLDIATSDPASIRVRTVQSHNRKRGNMDAKH